jgi:hypothetical protein
VSTPPARCRSNHRALALVWALGDLDGVEYTKNSVSVAKSLENENKNVYRLPPCVVG